LTVKAILVSLPNKDFSRRFCGENSSNHHSISSQQSSFHHSQSSFRQNCQSSFDQRNRQKVKSASVQKSSNDYSIFQKSETSVCGSQIVNIWVKTKQEEHPPPTNNLINIHHQQII